ncbi:DMT family transporter [Lactobacillus johnsonii]|uniref:QacE family quaternary ammonium compound efflux SMR transporter n=1 Tax=Lactobacillus johnsonii TaxID=33959 RepID=A0A9X6P0N0_LACJH|nr:multidrug efflux SMR transporter [Lactobacillus johnsonii]OYS06153.1 QacE family quaternary ammonium compound efflux SMR transporter [Lactobacillus johnsonii]OYS06540.1 QacE family quaternary ammonium compound efflux SMR transporter [Lactobacillus johnsonii]OYS08561.1 QacE family quaternary ammonium compound efflux SMR transporter [Lactobacillus johnsonii]OYS10886.1 QacE family quaternary ammonium compound efflux SMR transporter [Lactobacillus johnsonii]OYS13817.1 QacE family quaternary amm
MQWIYLVLAGLLECAWSTTMKLSNGFSHLWWSIVTVIGMILSFVFLSLSLKGINLSIAYPIWTGIGAVGAILVDVLVFHDSISPLTWFFIVLLITGIIGIKMTSH